jgi:hypothetical protein
MVDDSTNISWKLVRKISSSWVDVVIMSFYLESWIWPEAISWWIWQRVCTKFCANLGKCETETWQWLDKNSGKNAWAVHGKSKLTATKKDETGEDQSVEHVHHFLWDLGDCSQRIHPDRPNNQIRITVMFYGDFWKCVKTSPWSLATTGLALPSRQPTISHFLFHQGIYNKKQHDCCPPHPSYFSVFSWLKTKLRGHHFWHNWGDRGRITGGAVHPHKTRLPGCI